MKASETGRFSIYIAFSFFFYLLFPIPGNCSEFSFFINYTVNDGLPSSKVYDIIQDRKGYVWFATENGVSRFDGYDFTNFTVEEGLPTNSTLGLYEDYKGRIWFLSYLGPISYFDNSQIYPHPLNDSLKKLNLSFFTDIFVDSLDNLLLTKFYGGYVTVSKTNLINDFNPNERSDFKIIKLINSEDKITGWFINEPISADQSMNTISNNADTLLIRIKSPRTNNHLSYCANGNQVIIAFGSNLIITDNGNVITYKHFNNEITSLFCDKNNRLWVNEKFSGAHLFGNINYNTVFKTFLSGKTISKIIQSKDGNYWFTTSEDGVYYVPSIQFNTYNNNILNLEEDNIISIANFDSCLFFSTTGKGLYRASINDGNLIDIFPFRFESNIVTNFNDIIPVSNNELYVAGILYKNQDRNHFYSSYLNNPFIINLVGYGYSLSQTTDDKIIVCNKGGIQIYDKSNLVYSSEADSFSIKTFSVMEMPDSSLSIGTTDGLYIRKDGSYNIFAPGNKILEKRISTLNLLNKDIWVGTFDNGIAIIGKNGIKYISTKEGISSNRIKAVFAQNDSTVWVATNKGMNKIQIKDTLISKITIYSIWDGLPSNEINDILEHDGFLWLATQKGLVSFDPLKITNSQTAPALIMEKIKVNGFDTSFLAPNPELKYFQNSISFHYKGISYYNPGNIDYFYKLEGINNEWKHTRGTSLQFPDLSHGDYSFLIKAKNAAGILSSPFNLKFTIQKHFSETLFFKVLTFVLFAAFIIFIFLFILYRQKKRDELKRMVLVSEQKALRSQMNPHFIFNSLNSIHDIVINNKTGASKFIVDFSMLLRRILELSKYNTVSLSDELITIELYLSLEKNRLSDKFDYEVNVDNEIKTRFVKIPSMIIQPLLENAIWHGIAPLPSQTKGFISLTIKQVDNRISIIITDDGIGRKKASEIEKANDYKKSTGLANINERITIAKKIYKIEIIMQVVDLFDDRENTGTKVEITFGANN